MDEIELVRGLRSDVRRADPEQRQRARAALMEAIGAEFGRRGVAPRSRARVPSRRVLAIAVVATVIPAGIAVANKLDLGSPPSPEPVPGSAEPGPPEPKLTTDQQDRALALVATDTTAQQFLRGKDYEVQAIGPWGGERGEPLTGVVMVLHLAQPVAYPMQAWPLIDYRPGSDPPYREKTLHMAARNVTELMINVDLQRERVVNLNPSGEDAQITPGQDYLKQARQSSGY